MFEKKPIKYKGDEAFIDVTNLVLDLKNGIFINADIVRDSNNDVIGLKTYDNRDDFTNQRNGRDIAFDKDNMKVINIEDKLYNRDSNAIEIKSGHLKGVFEDICQDVFGFKPSEAYTYFKTNKDVPDKAKNDFVRTEKMNERFFSSVEGAMKNTIEQYNKEKVDGDGIIVQNNSFLTALNKGAGKMYSDMQLYKEIKDGKSYGEAVKSVAENKMIDSIIDFKMEKDFKTEAYNRGVDTILLEAKNSGATFKQKFFGERDLGFDLLGPLVVRSVMPILKFFARKLGSDKFDYFDKNYAKLRWGYWRDPLTRKNNVEKAKEYKDFIQKMKNDVNGLNKIDNVFKNAQKEIAPINDRITSLLKEKDKISDKTSKKYKSLEKKIENAFKDREKKLEQFDKEFKKVDNGRLSDKIQKEMKNAVASYEKDNDKKDKVDNDNKDNGENNNQNDNKDNPENKGKDNPDNNKDKPEQNKNNTENNAEKGEKSIENRKKDVNDKKEKVKDLEKKKEKLEKKLESLEKGKYKKDVQEIIDKEKDKLRKKIGKLEENIDKLNKEIEAEEKEIETLEKETSKENKTEANTEPKENTELGPDIFDDEERKGIIDNSNEVPKGVIDPDGTGWEMRIPIEDENDNPENNENGEQSNENKAENNDDKSKDKEIEEYKEKIAKLTEDNKNLENEKEKYKSELDKANEKIKDKDNQIEAKDKEIKNLEGLKADIESKNKDIADLKTENTNLNKEIENKNKDINDLKQEKNKLETEKNKLETEKNKLETEKNKLENENKELNNEIERKNDDIVGLKKEIEQHLEDNNEKDENIKELENAINEKNSEIEKLTNDKNNLKEKLDAKEQEVENLKQDKNETNNDMSSLEKNNKGIGPDTPLEVPDRCLNSEEKGYPTVADSKKIDANYRFADKLGMGVANAENLCDFPEITKDSIKMEERNSDNGQKTGTYEIHRNDFGKMSEITCDFSNLKIDFGEKSFVDNRAFTKAEKENDINMVEYVFDRIAREGLDNVEISSLNENATEEEKKKDIVDFFGDELGEKIIDAMENDKELEQIDFNDRNENNNDNGDKGPDNNNDNDEPEIDKNDLEDIVSEIAEALIV